MILKTVGQWVTVLVLISICGVLASSSSLLIVKSGYWILSIPGGLGYFVLLALMPIIFTTFTALWGFTMLEIIIWITSRFPHLLPYVVWNALIKFLKRVGYEGVF